MTKPWTPTHVITLEHPENETSTVRVMLVPNEGYVLQGPAYTKEEWETDAKADWELRAQGIAYFVGDQCETTLRGVWLFQGRPAPTDNTTVTVENVDYCRIPSYLSRSLLQALVNTSWDANDHGKGDPSSVLHSLVGVLGYHSGTRTVPKEVSQAILNGNLNTGGGNSQVVGWLVELLEAVNQKRYIR